MDTLSTRRQFLRTAGAGAAGLGLAGAAPLLSRSRLGTGNDPFPSPPGGGNPYPVHVFSKHLQFLNYPEMSELCAAAGAAGADLTVRPRGHVLPENVTRDLPLAAGALREAGLSPEMMTTRITDPEDPHTEPILATAAEQGIRYYRLGYYHYDDGRTVREDLDEFRRKMEGLARLNEKYGIHGAYQNHAGRYFGAPVWDLWELLRDLDPKWMGCQYDIRHGVAEGARTWMRPLGLMKDHIRCMVIKDFRWKTEEGRARVVNVPLGEGIIDFRDYFSRLSRLGISGPISLHMEYPLFPEGRDLPPGQKKEYALRAIRKDLAFINPYLT